MAAIAKIAETARIANPIASRELGDWHFLKFWQSWQS
jgi:hypothetical protein